MFKVLAQLIKILELFSVRTAARFTMFLASWPMRRPLKARDKALLAKGERLHIKGDKKLAAWSFGRGPLVILVHGWEGNSAQMATMAMCIAEQGFQAVTFDVRAHGSSKGKRAHFSNYSVDMRHVAQHFDRPIHAIVAHSAGGLLTMFGRMKKIVKANYYVTIAAPRAPYPPIEIVKENLGVSEKVADYCRIAIAQQFESPWDELITGKMYEYRGQGKLLLVYDKDDELVCHTDADQAQKYWPDALCIKTQGLGHFKLLWNDSVMNQVAQFISGEEVDRMPEVNMAQKA